MTAAELTKLWAEHLDGEFVSKDVEATLATMVEDASVNHMPVNTGGRGKEQLRVFCRDDFIPSWPDDLKMILVNRVIGEDQLVEELRLKFTHTKLMNWFLPKVPPRTSPWTSTSSWWCSSAATSWPVSAFTGTRQRSCARWD
jgi:carboxymethylenebutenolidase